MVQINWTFQARDDLRNIAEYISKDSVQYAKIQTLRLKSKTKILTKHPKIGRSVPEIDNPSVRELIVGNYRIIYKIISAKRIDILTIHHSARDLSKRTI